MDTYIGVKLIKAEPMRLGAYNEHRGWKIPSNQDPEKEGYLVTYPDGYISWSPKDQFELAYFKTEKEDSITEDDVFRFTKEHYADKNGEKTTILRTVLINDFELIDSSSCVDPKNYDQVIGSELCIKKNKDKIWFLLGFVLQWAKNGIKEKTL
jgi:hypothetical protein